MADWLGLPVAAAADADVLDHEMVLVHWLMLVLFVAWGSFFVYTLVRFRRAAHPVAVYERRNGWWILAIGGAVLAAEVVLLAFFSIPAWTARLAAFPVENASTVVRVVAEQFSWNVHYPGEDGRFGRTALAFLGPENPLGLDPADPAGRDDITTVNELHLPVNKPAIIYLSSKDVVHSFTLPQMRIKQDAIPGLVQPVWFTPTMTGAWEIACSQLCGLAHYRMKGFYVIQSENEFHAWLAERLPVAAVP